MNMVLNRITNNLDKASKYSMLLLIFFLPFSTAIMSVLAILTVVLIIFGGRWQEKIAAIRHNPIVFWSLLLFLLYVAGMFYSTAAWSERLYVLSKYSKLLLIPIFIPVFLDEKIRQLAVKIFMIAMVIILVVSYFQYFKIPPFAHLGFEPNAVFKNHSTANFLMAFAAFIFLIKFFAVSKHRWIYLAITILMIINVFFMGVGRIGYMLLFFLLPLAAYYRFKWLGMVTGLLVSCLLFFSAYHFSDTFRARTQYFSSVQHSEQDGSFNIRHYQAQVGLSIIKHYPIFGVGTGNFWNKYQEFAPLHDNSANIQTQYMQTFVELGVVGLIVLLLLIWQQFRWSVVLIPPYNQIAVAIALMQLISFLTLAAWMDTTESHLFAIFMALCFAGLKKEKKRVG